MGRGQGSRTGVGDRPQMDAATGIQGRQMGDCGCPTPLPSRVPASPSASALFVSTQPPPPPPPLPRATASWRARAPQSLFLGPLPHPHGQSATYRLPANQAPAGGVPATPLTWPLPDTQRCDANVEDGHRWWWECVSIALWCPDPPSPMWGWGWYCSAPLRNCHLETLDPAPPQ